MMYSSFVYVARMWRAAKSIYELGVNLRVLSWRKRSPGWMNQGDDGVPAG